MKRNDVIKELQGSFKIIQNTQSNLPVDEFTIDEIHIISSEMLSIAKKIKALMTIIKESKCKKDILKDIK